MDKNLFFLTIILAPFIVQCMQRESEVVLPRSAQTATYSKFCTAIHNDHIKEVAKYLNTTNFSQDELGKALLQSVRHKSKGSQVLLLHAGAPVNYVEPIPNTALSTTPFLSAINRAFDHVLPFSLKDENEETIRWLLIFGAGNLEVAKRILKSVFDSSPRHTEIEYKETLTRVEQLLESWQTLQKPEMKQEVTVKTTNALQAIAHNNIDLLKNFLDEENKEQDLQKKQSRLQMLYQQAYRSNNNAAKKLLLQNGLDLNKAIVRAYKTLDLENLEYLLAEKNHSLENLPSNLGAPAVYYDSDDDILGKKQTAEACTMIERQKTLQSSLKRSNPFIVATLRQNGKIPKRRLQIKIEKENKLNN